MKYVKIPLVYHDGEVHSVDINHEGTKLLSSGKDCKINVWNLEDFYQVGELKPDTRFDKIQALKTFDYHKSVVNIVRWNPKSNFFVSGDSDGYLYLNNIDGEFRCIYPFHKIDPVAVIDISWSSNGKIIAWSTQDGKVNLFDIEKNTYQELTKLTHLDKLTIQRSIAFDPTGNYLMTLGDDTLVYLYQYSYDDSGYQFRLINKISKLLNKNPSNVDYKRISWSPDGELLSIPTASKNQTTLISLISRSKNWQNRISLVGHGLNCEVVSFNPKIFDDTIETAKLEAQVEVSTQNGQPGNCENLQDNQVANDCEHQSINERGDQSLAHLENESTNQVITNLPDQSGKPAVSQNGNHLSKQSENIYNIIATAGSDKTLTVWNTSKDTPVLILKDIMDKSVVDLVWDPSGRHLLLCSLDGHIGLITFEDLELGSEISNEIKLKLDSFVKDFVKPLNFKYEQEQVTGRKNTQNMIEFLEQKDAIDTTKEEIAAPNNLQENEVEPSNGKPEEAEDEPAKGDIIPEIVQPGDTGEKTTDILHSAMNNRASKAKKLQTKVATTKEDNTIKQKITTKNGKRRIQPLLISSSNGTRQSKVESNGASDSPPTLELSGNSLKSLMEYVRPSYSVSEEFHKQHKRVRNDDTTTNKKLKRELEPMKFIGSVIVNPSTAFAKVRLAIPKSRLGFQISTKIDNEVCILDIKNGSGNETKPSRITYFRKEKQIWTDFIPRYLQLAVEGLGFWAISTADGQVLTYSHTSGRRILPPLILGSPVSFLESHSDFLMAVTCIGEIFVWNVTTKKIELSSNLSPLLEICNKYLEEGLSKSDNISMCSINSSGIPIVTLSNGSGYLFNKDLESWQTITESWWAFGSHYWDSTNGPTDKNDQGGLDKDNSIVELLEHKTNEEIIRKTRTGRGKYFNKINKNMIMKEGFENLENTISLSHLENRILCCELLGEKEEFHNFFITYIKRVCELGLKAKLFEICVQLLGPEDEKNGTESDSKWNPLICGYEKRELLKELIYACSNYRDSQRILIHFGKKIGIIDVDS